MSSPFSPELRAKLIQLLAAEREDTKKLLRTELHSIGNKLGDGLINKLTTNLTSALGRLKSGDGGEDGANPPVQDIDELKHEKCDCEDCAKGLNEMKKEEDDDDDSDVQLIEDCEESCPLAKKTSMGSTQQLSGQSQATKQSAL